MKILSKAAIVATALLAGTESIAAKKILLAFDGSGQNPANSPPSADKDKQLTNIMKLHLLAGGSVDPDKTKENVSNQISLWNKGVGSEASKIEALLNNLLGVLGQQTRPMMKRLQNVYEEGDQLYIIGFSRGAAAARKFVVGLEKKGLRTASGKKVKKPDVEFLGCFDTVSMQLWNPFQRFGVYYRLITGGLTPSTVLGEKNGQLPNIVKKAVHNMSMDDPRFRVIFFPYNPVHMDSKDVRVHEVWFPGNHADVGGGYYVDGVSNGSGNYMKQFMEKAGMAFLTPEQVDTEQLKFPNNPEIKIVPKDISLLPDPTAKSHCQKSDSLRPILSVSKNKVIENGTVRIHESFFERVHGDSFVNKTVGDGTEKIPYVINPSVLKTDFVVVGDLDEVIPEKTKELKQKLQQ